VRRIAIGGAALLSLFAAWFLAPRIGQFIRDRGISARSEARPGHRSTAAATSAIENAGKGPPRVALRVRSAPPGTRFHAMPPVNTPMRIAYPQIKEQADEGDPVAQCRLAYEVLRCKRLPELIRTAADPKAQSRSASMASMLEGEIAKDRAVCQDFSPAAGDETWHLMLESALNGNRSAALDFATGLWLNPRKPEADPEGLAAYREYAPRLLQQAVAAGDSRAYQLAAMYGKFAFNPFGVRLVPSDPIQVGAYYLAIMPIADASYRPFLQKQVESLGLNDADMAEARARAGSLGLALKPPPDGDPIVGNNIVGWGKWDAAERCEH
jgi:hypothetical protein